MMKNMENSIDDIFDPKNDSKYIYDHTGAENLELLFISTTYDVECEYEFVPYEYE